MKNNGMKMVESVIKGMVKDEVISLNSFFISLKNAFRHGDICPQVDQEGLDKLFEHFEGLVEVSKEY